ncbi:MAG: hypothetical protein N2653_04650 [Burkholderiales bacterium]|nr:hypothetical protein [Burkholderiales bacterium]
MAIGARWIRLGGVGPRELLAALAGLAAAQSPRAAPIAVWARAAAPVENDLVRAEEDGLVFALIAPARLAPGRASRWTSWVLAPVLAAWRALGAHGWAGAAELWVHGTPAARAAAARIGACVVASASLAARSPYAASDPRTLESLIRTRLEAQHGWQFDNSWANAHERAAIAAAAPEPAFAR